MRNFDVELDLRSVAIHEAGHAVAGNHFRVGSAPTVFVKHTGAGVEVGGATFWEYKPTKFADCVMTWAGVMAEDLFDSPARTRTRCPFKPSTHLREWHFFVLAMQHELSESDRAGINLFKHPWRAVKSAYRILAKKSDEVKAMAARLFEDERQSHRDEAGRAEQEWQGEHPEAAADWAARWKRHAELWAQVERENPNMTKAEISKIVAEREFELDKGKSKS